MKTAKKHHRTRRATRLLPLVGLAVLAAGWPAPAVGAGTLGGTKGYACAYSTNISIAGGPFSVRGCGQTIPPGDATSASPEVTQPPGGTNTLIKQTDANGARAAYNYWVMFSAPSPSPAGFEAPSGPLTASTQGISPVLSSASAQTVGLLGWHPLRGKAHKTQFNASYVYGRCTAEPGYNTFFTNIQNGVVVTSTDSVGNPLTSVAVPPQPPANYTINGTMDDIGDSFQITFNEQIANPDGSFTLNAVHVRLLGPWQVGDIIVGQATCGV
jgi:hypothetical protein